MTMSDEQQKGDSVLADEDLVHHFTKMTKELEFLADMEFVKFWAYMIKLPLFINFCDDYLQQVRKYNDFEKINIDLDQSLNDSKISQSGDQIQNALKKQVNKSLKVVFQIFYRLSQNMGSQAEYFTVDFYKTLVY